MTAERDVADFLEDILDAISKVEDFVTGMTFEEFVDDDKTAFAVVRALEIIGEASARIPREIRDVHSGVPWREMIGIRNKLAHGYFGVDLRIVWNTVMDDLPNLAPVITVILEGLDGEV